MQGQSVAICTDDISRSQWAEIVESTSLARLAETRPLPTAAAGLPMPIELRHEQRYVQGFSALLFGTGRHAPNSNLTRPSPYALTSIHQYTPATSYCLSEMAPTQDIVTEISSPPLQSYICLIYPLL
jgi:hypothetical protein